MRVVGRHTLQASSLGCRMQLYAIGSDKDACSSPSAASARESEGALRLHVDPPSDRATSALTFGSNRLLLPASACAAVAGSLDLLPGDAFLRAHHALIMLVLYRREEQAISLAGFRLLASVVTVAHTGELFSLCLFLSAPSLLTPLRSKRASISHSIAARTSSQCRFHPRSR
jgi:hypothetical protein